MEKACYGRPRGPLVTPQEFHEKATSDYRGKSIFSYCPQCDEEADLYGLHNWRISRFDHKNRPEGWNSLDDCPLSNRHDARYDGMHSDGWDHTRGEQLRREFQEDGNLRVAYAFALKLAHKGNLPKSKWHSMMRRADRKNIWAYVDIPLWIIPYILLTLENFTQEATGEKKGYDFHFVFVKPNNTSASTLWSSVVATSLKKVFSNTGATVTALNNPFPISEAEMRKTAGDAAWVREDFLRLLKV